MINQVSIKIVDASIFSTNFRKPLYDSYGFSNIPQTIIGALTDGKLGLPADVLGNFPTHYKKVIFFFVDAFGWRFFERYKDRYPILKKLSTQGVVSKLTSQFPSTTVAHVTTANTGLSVGQHGIYEWNYYEPTMDAVIQPLFFSYADKAKRESLKLEGVDPFSLFPHETVHQKLVKTGIPTHVYQLIDYAQSSYGDVVMQGSVIHPFTTLNEGLTTLAKQVLSEERGYYYFYFDGIDSVGHHYGPESHEFDVQVDEFLKSLEKLFIDKLDGKLTDTLFLMSADHGQVDSSPGTCFYINREAPEIIPMLQTTKNGKIIIPAGSPRDFFLHVKQEYLGLVREIITPKLEGIAEVYLVSQLIEEGFFGPLPLSEKFFARVGNLIILPYAHHSVWWFEEGVFWQKHIGHHGGLTTEEMETILYAYTFKLET
ncbi:phosphodiesterase [Candidatus Collierbacteria bacterium CG10_big_fil_rev_8_21_14_0_10_44_9]|uniref:Phosphodiesterase n=1 Tax=Candidatus Collierbacteria bacterium CG10_big_fil_rev_8_21_14_0_10_44_9 TaxID=1974535 RepID=A0A2H0VIC3_9BACT|nr:MAG: phosphodiesterase [Candidatus Collierbacteria bacterium CG10_big_fil_rev_8_21_14_0_10_44_9]